MKNDKKSVSHLNKFTTIKRKMTKVPRAHKVIRIINSKYSKLLSLQTSFYYLYVLD